MPEYQVTRLDVIVLLGYVLGTRLLFGWLASRVARRGAEGYFLAGKRLTWPLIGLSFYVSNMSGSSFVGLPASGYAHGVAVFHYEWLPALILVGFCVVFLPVFLRARVYTAPEYLERRYGRGCRLGFAAFLLLANVFIDAAAALYAGGVIMQVLFPAVPLWMTIALACLLAGVYISVGGLEAVVLNDVVQASMIVVGGAIVGWKVWEAVPSWEAVRAASPPHALQLLQPASDPNLPWPGVLSGVLVIGVYFWCTNQFVIQRALGARDLDQARKGSLFAALLKLPNLFLLVLPGAMAVVLYPELESADHVFPTLVFDLLPAGLRAVMLAALVAAILSSLEAILNAAATLFTMDFVKTLRPQTGDAALVWCGRLSTLGFTLLAALWAPQIQRFPDLWTYLQSVLAYVTPPVVVVFVGGMLWPRGSHAGATATLLTGLVTGAGAWIAVEIHGLVELQFLYACGLLTLLAAAVFVVVSLLRPDAAPADAERGLWTRQLARDAAPPTDRPWPQRFGVQATALLVLTAALVLWWL